MLVEIVLDNRVGNMERERELNQENLFKRMIATNLIQRNDIDIIGYLLISNMIR